MSNRRWVPVVCLAAALIMLGVGFIILNPWLAAALLPVAGLTAGVIRRERSEWLPSALLITGVITAAGGILLGVSPRLMVAATSLFLAGWQLSGGKTPPFESIALGGGRGARWSEGRLLVVSVGGGLLAAEAGLGVQASLPFGVVLLAALLVLGCLYAFSRITSKIPN